jgi:phage shock protein E
MLRMFKSLFAAKGNSKLKELIEQGAMLVDVRSAAEFAAGNVKGSVNIPLDRLQSQLHRFKTNISMVVFCRSGNRSSMAKSILEQNGFLNVANGGSWKNVNEFVNLK